MNEAVSKGLEGALRTVVAANNGSGGTESGGAPNDLMSLAMKVLPMLQEREDLVEMQKEKDTALRKDLHLMRRQLRELTEELRLMREMQLVMVDHLARVQILDVPEEDHFDEEFSDEFDEPEDLPKVSRKVPSARRRSGTSREVGEGRTPRRTRKPRQ
ncbi:MAG: hypothetical protein PVG22_05315 [Chromatiales bacterium]|jgi:hypothetical protein